MQVIERTKKMSEFPNKIICLTEESVELIYLLGLEHKIVGVSAYVKRPERAQKLLKVSGFTSGNVKKIVSLAPDLVLGFSDIQKDLARELIGEGVNVFIANHRTINETLDYLLMLGRMLGAGQKTEAIVASYQGQMRQIKQRVSKHLVKPKIYFEEWDDPKICGINWVGELIELCGGEDICSEYRKSLAKQRIVEDRYIIEKDPDIILGCWCGKKVDLDAIKRRPGWSQIKAVRNDWVCEVEPEIFLQPGPALFEDGINQLLGLIEKWQEEQ
jgi:iron complex transport system substrate-binding protein